MKVSEGLLRRVVRKRRKLGVELDETSLYFDVV